MHGICPECALSITRGAPRTAGEILNTIAEPIFLIDSDGVVKGANLSALGMLGKELPDIQDEMGGDALECTYAKDAAGCGRTVHCRTCAIRNTVMDTLRTGHGYDKVPAFQSIDTGEGPVVMRFVITTEKLGGNVLLRVDSARKAFSS